MDALLRPHQLLVIIGEGNIWKYLQFMKFFKDILQRIQSVKFHLKGLGMEKNGHFLNANYWEKWI